jgi:hypothetical protein
MNMYNYVGSDPINATDPDGLATILPQRPADTICVTGTKPTKQAPKPVYRGGGTSTTSAFGYSSFGGSAPPPIVPLSQITSIAPKKVIGPVKIPRADYCGSDATGTHLPQTPLVDVQLHRLVRRTTPVIDLRQIDTPVISV